jgi:hypothetical protein
LVNPLVIAEDRRERRGVEDPDVAADDPGTYANAALELALDGVVLHRRDLRQVHLVEWTRS